MEFATWQISGLFVVDQNHLKWKHWTACLDKSTPDPSMSTDDSKSHLMHTVMWYQYSKALVYLYDILKMYIMVQPHSYLNG